MLNENEDFLKKEIAEFNITVAYPENFKRDHYHDISNEWFILILGSTLELFDLKSNKKNQIKL